MNKEIKEKIDNLIKTNKVVLFMKGTPQFPDCGFSANTSTILKTLDVDFEYVNVLLDNELREGIKEYSNWPTIPQLYIDGEFMGGNDIMTEIYESGELQEKLKG